jgi:hypothetical protein
MNATEVLEQKAESVTAEMTAEEAVELARKTEDGKNRSGLQRKVHFLWSGANFAYVRINFHNPDMNNYIVKSAFLRVTRN